MSSLGIGNGDVKQLYVTDTIIENMSNKETTIPETDIRTELDRILASPVFSRAKREGSFLEFVVEETLANRGDRLKAFTIAQAVYGRDETFDPRTGTIVRVEAGRLRQRLADYYQNEGRNDRVVITLPKGGYTPVFTIKENVIPAPEADKQTGKEVTGESWFSHLTSPVSLAVAVIAVILVVWFIDTDDIPTETNQPTSSRTSDASMGQQPALYLTVLPLKTLANDPLEERLAAGLVEAIITDMAKLSGLSVMAHTSLLNLKEQTGDLDSIKRDFGVTHALRGSLEHQANLIRVNVQLIELSTKKTIWAERLDGDINNLLELQDILAQKIVKHMAVQVSKDERAKLNRQHSNNPEVLALYRQALILMMPPNNLERILSARYMFERVIEIDPGFGGGYSGLGFTHIVSSLFLHSDNPGQDLRLGINLALKSIEIDPEFGMGYVTLAFAYAMSGRKEEALYNARQAVAIQPGNAFTQFVYGMSLTISGHSGEGIAPLLEAIRLDPAEPRTPYRNVLGITYFVNGDHILAAKLFEDNITLGGPAGPHVDVFRAATYARLGQNDMARKIINDLVSNYPEFPVKQWLAKWHRTDEEVSETLEYLYQLGLPRV